MMYGPSPVSRNIRSLRTPRAMTYSLDDFQYTDNMKFRPGALTPAEKGL